ncbi:3-hydroxyacyl-CoA dehydrogenase NAD-binding domain-containing protein [Botrimarina hoheduenensis]|uniref:enoyl-CoA hydratase n=1 Tax=Botrimarina hoheduenensis TaxID=2528000 RepID=A0A5C5W748_9BACT|nr:3-hydroxyacyl-CoA dehydrogenase NAD-binding domain-containing protein [Botrimarina hoheduenensis]TWT46688.1 Fatty acid oxidation complex subunit alpha [Botrimarina hoheduenensis]
MASHSESLAAATTLSWVTHAGGRVAVLTLDLPGKSANLLSAAVLDELSAHFDKVDAAHDARGLVITSAKPGVFIAGADLREFAAGLDRPPAEIIAMARRGQTLFARLAEAAYPTVAAIAGVCVGGGAELAIWCDRRVMADTPATQFGFPEVKLGLFPGWGGTARTPRVIGLANALELVTSGESVDAGEAYKLGLADDLVPPAESSSLADPSASRLLTAALAMLDAEHKSGAWQRDRQRWSQPIAMSETELAFLGATASAVIQQKTGGHYPAPMAALELMLEASQLDLHAACLAEAEAFAPLFGSSVNRALLNVFFLTDRAKKTGGTVHEPIATATVIGAGIMGQGIAAANLKRGVAVRLSDAQPEALAAGVASVVREASYNKKTKAADLELALHNAALIAGTNDSTQLAAADVVIEAVIEAADVKRSLFAQLEPLLRPDALLASNTSTIPITTLAHGLERPELFCGLHFFNPVRKMPLVEVIRGKQTSEATVERMAAYARQLGKTPVVVNDGPGFLVNRLLLPYMNEAALLASEGVPFKLIDKAAKGFGMPMGPLELHDVVGLDTCVHAGRVMQAAFSDRVTGAPILERLLAAGRKGQKNGAGFYDYPPSKPGKPPRPVASAAAEALQDHPVEGVRWNPEDLANRLLLPMLVEATRALEDGIVTDPRDVDLALVLGIGFPPHRGGLFFWADTIGAVAILERLEPLQPLGKRFEPTELLKDVARTSGKFSSRPQPPQVP